MGCIQASDGHYRHTDTPPGTTPAVVTTAENRQHPLPIHAATTDLSDALQALDNAVGELEHRLQSVLTPTEPSGGATLVQHLVGIGNSAHADHLGSRARWVTDLHERVLHILDRLEL